MSQKKKVYLISLHSFQGSMRESTGDHFVASLSEEEVIKLEKEVAGMHEEKEMFIEPVTELLQFSDVLVKAREFMNEGFEENTELEE